MNTATVTSLDVVHEKFLLLNDLLRPLLAEGLLVAFSGGVDSAFLTWAAERERRRSGGRLAALTALSESFSRTEKADAARFIEENCIEHHWVESKELLNPEYAVNDSNRCFHCKTELFTICHEAAKTHDLKWIAYGFNASDRGDFRPGHRAAVENSILSPLADTGLTKDDIRLLMRENGLEMADKPASPCLSSRLMTGVPITPQKLNDVEQIEAILRDGGLRVFRVRLHEEGKTRFLRLEVAPDEMNAALEFRDRVVAEALARGYKWVTLDLAGYKMGGGNLIVK
jgi:uncharacterized protein